MNLSLDETTKALLHHHGCTCDPVVLASYPTFAGPSYAMVTLTIEHDKGCWLRVRFERVAAAPTN